MSETDLVLYDPRNHVKVYLYKYRKKKAKKVSIEKKQRIRTHVWLILSTHVFSLRFFRTTTQRVSQLSKLYKVSRNWCKEEKRNQMPRNRKTKHFQWILVFEKIEIYDLLTVYANLYRLNIRVILYLFISRTLYFNRRKR